MKIEKEVVYTITYNEDRDQFKMNERELSELHSKLQTMFGGTIRINSPIIAQKNDTMPVCWPREN